jgi:hypothetical protein
MGARSTVGFRDTFSGIIPSKNGKQKFRWGYPAGGASGSDTLDFILATLTCQARIRLLGIQYFVHLEQKTSNNNLTKRLSP